MILIGSSRLGNQCLPIFLAVIVSIIILALMVDFNSPWFPPSTWFGGFHSPPPSHNQCLLLLFCYPLFWASPSFSIVIIKLKTPFADFFCVPQRKQKTPSLLYMKFTTLHPPPQFLYFFHLFQKLSHIETNLYPYVCPPSPIIVFLIIFQESIGEITSVTLGSLFTHGIFFVEVNSMLN